MARVRTLFMHTLTHTTLPFCKISQSSNKRLNQQLWENPTKRSWQDTGLGDALLRKLDQPSSWLRYFSVSKKIYSSKKKLFKVHILLAILWFCHDAPPPGDYRLNYSESFVFICKVELILFCDHHQGPWETGTWGWEVEEVEEELTLDGGWETLDIWSPVQNMISPLIGTF